MNAAVLLYRDHGSEPSAVLASVDLPSGRVLERLSVPTSVNLGVFPRHDCVLVAFTDDGEGGAGGDWLNVYRFSDWSLQARLPMDCRASFNGPQRWPTFIASPDDRLIYVYKSRTLGHHRAEDFVCGLDPAAMTFTTWNFKIPECVAGWSGAGGRAHAQMLFVSDGLEVGKMPTTDLQQKIGFWLGPGEGMGPTIPLGLRPRVHSDLGHARAIVSARRRPLSVVVCTDGTAHLIDPVAFRHVERQRVQFADRYGMPIFSALVDPDARFLYVGTSAREAWHEGLIERVVVHDLARGHRHAEWVLPEPFTHLVIDDDGRHLFGASCASNTLWLIDCSTGTAEIAAHLDDPPRHVIAL
jgi:hypothetical protein